MSINLLLEIELKLFLLSLLLHELKTELLGLKLLVESIANDVVGITKIQRQLELNGLGAGICEGVSHLHQLLHHFDLVVVLHLRLELSLSGGLVGVESVDVGCILDVVLVCVIFLTGLDVELPECWEQAVVLVLEGLVDHFSDLSALVLEDEKLHLVNDRHPWLQQVFNNFVLDATFVQVLNSNVEN